MKMTMMTIHHQMSMTMKAEASADELRPTRNFSFLNEAKIMYVLVLIETVELGITRLTNVCY